MKQVEVVKTPIVSVDWLQSNLDVSNLVILDGSMKKVTDATSQLSTVQIPNTRFFDIKNVFSNTDNPFPNAVPSEEHFTTEAQNLGINSNSCIVVYDDKGIYSSARAWWLFKAFNHNNVAVLDGGLPEWIAKGFPVEEKQTRTFQKGNFVGSYQPQYFKFFKDIQTIIPQDDYLILDARSANRFKGLDKEPREGLRSGHIPNSVNLPFSSLLHQNKLKSADELKSIFDTFDIKGKPMIFSCGSGITACVLALGAEISGYTNTSVYDGSWTEYGTLTTE